MSKQVCIVYVQAMREEAERVFADLSANGFSVCLHQASADEIAAANDGELLLNDELKKCIDSAEVCVFLLPKDNQEALFINGAGRAVAGAVTRMVCVLDPAAVLSGSVFDERANAALRAGSENISDAIAGADVWEVDTVRDVRRQRCQ